MAVQVFGGARPRGFGMLAQVLCLIVLCIAFAPMHTSAQGVLSLRDAYYLPGGFFIYNLQDGYFVGAHQSWFLTEATYDFALANPTYYLFNLSYNRNIGGPPSSFNSSQWFEINMPSTVSATYLQWNVYGWSNPVDMYFVQSQAYGNTLWAFQLVDPVNYFYTIISQFNGRCVQATGGGHLNVEPCQLDNTAQLFQFINPYVGSAEQTKNVAAVSLSTAYHLPQYFMAYNVHDNAVLGKNTTSWTFQESTDLASAALNPLFFFNLSFNRALFSNGPTFTEESLFEINCPATATATGGGTYLEWNVYGYQTSVALYNVPPVDELQTNLMWTFTLVDPLNNLYLISPNLVEGANDCMTAAGNTTFIITPCDRINTAQLFQLINPNNVIPLPTTSTTTTTTKSTAPTQGWVEITCFANSSFTALSSWQSSVQGGIISAVTTVLSSQSSPLSVIAVTAFNVQSGQQGATVRVVVQAATSQLSVLVQQGSNSATSSLNALLVSKGVGQLSSVQVVYTPSGDIQTDNNPSSSSSGFFSEGWQVAVFVIVILFVVLVAIAYVAWRLQQRRNGTLVSGKAASSGLPGLKMAELDNATLDRRGPEGERNIRKNSASLELGGMAPFAGKHDDGPVETGDSAEETGTASLTNSNDDSDSPVIRDV